jgi:hypothetical protein
MLRARNIAPGGPATSGAGGVCPLKKTLAKALLVNVAVNTDSSCCGAMGDRLFEALDAEWATVGTSPEARAAFGRWAMEEPALAGMNSPAEAVASCRGAAPATSAPVLGALLRHAKEPLAARAVLQTVVPSLRIQAARRVGGARQMVSGQGWEAGDDFDADVVEVALRRIAELAGTSPPWPAQAICESTWMTMRCALVRSARWGTPATLDEDVASREASPERSDAEALTVALVDAVRAQCLPVDDAAVIYTTRVLGRSAAELASAQGRTARALRAQRSRAEQRLVDAGWAPRARPRRIRGSGAAQPAIAG